MDKWTSEDLSPKERELIIDFAEWAGEFDREILERQNIETIGNRDTIGIEEVFEFLVPRISEDATEFDAWIFRLSRLRSEIQSLPVFEYEHEDELPSDSVVTPEELNAIVVKEELEDFFILVGQMIEALTIELVMESVVDPSRESKSVRKRVERKSQRDREWLLYITGVIDDGEKGEIRRAYNLRSSLVHDSDNAYLEDIDVQNPKPNA